MGYIYNATLTTRMAMLLRYNIRKVFHFISYQKDCSEFKNVRKLRFPSECNSVGARLFMPLKLRIRVKTFNAAAVLAQASTSKVLFNKPTFSKRSKVNWKCWNYGTGL
jgi:hypothetical protein